MEIQMHLLGKNNEHRLLSKQDIKLLFGRITQNMHGKTVIDACTNIGMFFVFTSKLGQKSVCV
ncbi:hypothetical protein J4441_01150 [Candidatus Micrarchaeota archaeon]|nr:hypothetical protein [Candidatus Micrarchaeota archaeon]